ncbi:MAG: hypothetical protein ACI4NA_03390, partial [Succinivibrio sp.]
MDNTINQTQSTSEVSYSDMSGNCSVQMAFAMLQMSMGELMKENAMSYIEDIQEAQEQAKQISEAIEQLRTVKSQVTSDEFKDLTTMDKIDDKLSDLDDDIAKAQKKGDTDKVAELQQQKDDLEAYKANLESAISAAQAMGVDTSGLEKDINADNIELVIENLESKSETATSAIQQQMVFV